MSKRDQWLKTSGVVIRLGFKTISRVAYSTKSLITRGRDAFGKPAGRTLAAKLVISRIFLQKGKMKIWNSRESLILRKSRQKN